MNYKFISPCDSVEKYEKLNKIEEGSYGIVYRARNTIKNEIVALKKLKLEKEKNGFPITSLREISILTNIKNDYIVNVQEVVVGERLDRFIYYFLILCLVFL